MSQCMPDRPREKTFARGFLSAFPKVRLLDERKAGCRARFVRPRISVRFTGRRLMLDPCHANSQLPKYAQNHRESFRGCGATKCAADFHHHTQSSIFRKLALNTCKSRAERSAHIRPCLAIGS